jgi:hypothetical protein
MEPKKTKKQSIIDISPAMVTAGRHVLELCEADDDLELIAVTVYEAMARAADSPEALGRPRE